MNNQSRIGLALVGGVFAVVLLDFFVGVFGVGEGMSVDVDARRMRLKKNPAATSIKIAISN